MEQTIIEIDNLNVGYDRHDMVLTDLNLSIKASSIFGFLGRNGAGKSTLLKTIMGLVKPKTGSIKLFNLSIEQHQREIFSRIGTLIDSPSIYNHLTGIENLKVYGKYHNLKKSRIDEVVDIVALGDNAKKKGKTYSMGMRQRLGLALAILNDPEFLILDEPTNGLDPQGRVDFLNTIRQLNLDGKTVLISSHLLSEIEQIATHIGILENKKFVFQGTMDELHSFNRNAQLVTFKVSNPELGSELLKSTYSISQEHNTNQLNVQIRNESEIPEIIKVMTANEIDIYAVIPNQKNLEGLFFESIG